jgi:carbamoyl-phosphate synthase large subunit
VSVRDDDKPAAAEVARQLEELGFTIMATGGTAEVLARAGIEGERVNKVNQGRPHIVDRLRSRDVAMVVNTTSGAQALRDSYSLRRQTLLSGIPYFTTMAAAAAGCPGEHSRLRG